MREAGLLTFAWLTGSKCLVAAIVGARRLIGTRLVLALALLAGAALSATAQDRGNPEGEWRYWGADQWSTRYSPLDQINAENFE
jgi:glucose dehydrogenase